MLDHHTTLIYLGLFSFVLVQTGQPMSDLTQIVPLFSPTRRLETLKTDMSYSENDVAYVLMMLMTFEGDYHNI